jgi:diguanylate cyclase (GGDEF)-like protein
MNQPPDQTTDETVNTTTDLTMTVALTGARSALEERFFVMRVVAGHDLLRFVVVPEGGTVTIGRSAGADLVLEHASISRLHAEVAHHRTRGVEVRDLGSKNGTSVNGRPVVIRSLRAGDLVEVGAVALRFDTIGSAELAYLSRVQRKLESVDCDPLTGLRSRSYLEEEFPGVLEEATAEGRPVSAVFVDLDCFKDVNDRFGHGVGDDVLRTIATLILLDVRSTDVCVRFGGDEVVIVMPDTKTDAARATAERIRQAVARTDWDRLASGLCVTVSCGVGMAMPGDDATGWLTAIDAALYEAKTSGRNTVRVACAPVQNP